MSLTRRILIILLLAIIVSTIWEIFSNKRGVEQAVQETVIQPSELEASGQLEPVGDENGQWNLYNNPEVGFSFQYPSDVILLTEAEKTDPDETYLSVSIQDIGGPAAPMKMSAEEEQETIEALSRGEFGAVVGFPLSISEKVKPVGFLFAQDFMVLTRFEVCDVTLQRKLIFYFNNKQTTITSSGPIDILEESMPEYFAIDTENCGTEKVWKLDDQDEFYEKLASGKGSPEIQKWFDDFDQLSETIVFAHR